MVRAILDGRKCQTRRLIKCPPPADFTGKAVLMDNEEPGYWAFGAHHILPKYFPGDQLWVKETFHHDFEHARYFYRADADEDGSVPYLMDGSGGFGGGVCNAKIAKWTPSIFCPRRASRITLKITDVRVERLNAISEEDAMAEGASMPDSVVRDDSVHGSRAWVESYRLLWESINGAGSWALNPWVWVVKFDRVAT